MSWPLRIVRSLFGLAGLALTVAGVPLLLWHVLGNPVSGWRALFQSNGGLWSTLTTPVVDGTGLLPLLLVSVGWLLWAYYTFAVLLEVAAQLGNVSIRIPGFGLPRVAAGPIVALCLSVVIATPLVLGAATAAFADPVHDHGNGLQPTTSATGSSAGSATRHGSDPGQQDASGSESSARPAVSDHQNAADAQPASQDHAASHSQDGAAAHPAAAHDETVTVDRGDSLWRLAEIYYGDGMEWHKIAAANASLVGDHGQHLLEPGWQLTIPDVAHQQRDAQPGETYEVRQGDNLSTIAESAYGDAGQWRQIFDANHDQIHDPDEINVGQDLTLPGRQSEAHDAGHASHGGASAGVVGATGHQADHTSHAHDRGRESHDRATTSTAATPSAPTTSAPSQPHSSQSARSNQEQPTGRARSATDATADDEQVSPLVWAAPASALLAAGVLSLVVARRRSHQIRRPAGRRIRPYSDNASAAVTALRHVASSLTVAHLDRATRTLSARLAQRGDRLPVVTVARLADDRIDLLLGEPATEPPAPFTATTPTVWTLRAEDADELLDARDANEVAAPWPALVTLGRDTDGAHLLIDLETVASLAIHADEPADVPGLLAAMAIELTTSTWADDLTLTLVGCCDDLVEASGVDRVRYVDDISDLVTQLEREARHSRQLLVAEGLPAARQGRLDAETADSWTPHVILIGSPVDDETSERLKAVLSESPRVAIAAVTSGATDQLTDWSLNTPPIASVEHGPDETDDSVQTGAAGQLDPLGLKVSPQYVDATSYAAILQVLKESQTAADEPAPWWNDRAGTDSTSYTSCRDTDEAAAYADADDLSIDVADLTDDTDELPPGDFEVGAAADDAATDTTDEDATDVSAGVSSNAQVPAILTLPVAATSDPESSAGAESSDEEAHLANVDPVAAESSGQVSPDSGNELGDDDDVAAVGVTIPLHRPTVRLLGPVDILNVTGTLAAKRSPTELYEPIAWVLLHPDGPTTQFRADMRHTSDANALASRARRYLGMASDGETPLFPAARRTVNGRTYRLHDEVESDWHLFCELIDGGANTAPTQNLIQALRLVRGKPLASVTPWAWSDEWIETATAAIVDTAHVLAQRSLAANKIKIARAAVRRGRLVDDLVELLICDEIRIELAAHNFGRVERLCNQLLTNARQQKMELSAESVALLNEIRTLNRRRAASND